MAKHAKSEALRRKKMEAKTSNVARKGGDYHKGKDHHEGGHEPEGHKEAHDEHEKYGGKPKHGMGKRTAKNTY
jgi:hypothetical protein